MGMFDKLFKKAPKKTKQANTLNGYAPIFTQYGAEIYASDVVQQALECIADEIKKLSSRLAIRSRADVFKPCDCRIPIHRTFSAQL